MEASTVTNNKPGAGSYIAAVLIPIVGAILSIVQFARGNSGPGAALLLTAIVAGIVWFMILAGVAVNDYDQCIKDADTFAQQMRC